MKELRALLKVKSIMTLCVMGVFVYLSVTDRVDTAVTSSVITAVITYYFTKENSAKGE